MKTAWIQLQSEYFDDDSLAQFWNYLVEVGVRQVKIELDYESATLTATCSDWPKSTQHIIGVKLNALEVMGRWDNLAQSDIDDIEFDTILKIEVDEILNSVLRVKPHHIVVDSVISP